MLDQLKQQMAVIKNVGKTLNAIVTEADIESQYEQQKENDGPLHNVLVAVKDNFSTKGIRTTASSKILDNYVPFFDATAIEKLKAAGAIIAVKTSMDELGMGGTNLSAHTGPVHNPYDLTRISGGSSGGSAALVASGAVRFALGTDTGDSVRKPASYCGIVGVKPTYGRISRFGVIPYATSLDHVGYFTRNIHDAAIMLGVLAGRDDKDMTSSYQPVPDYTQFLTGDVSGKVFGVLENVYELVNEASKTALDQVLKQLEQQGATIRFIRLDDALLKAFYGTYAVLSNAEATTNHANLDGIRFGVRAEGVDVEDVMIKSRTQGLSSYIRKRMTIGGYALEEENQEELYLKAQKVRRKIVEAFEAAFEDIDCLLTIAHDTKPQVIGGPSPKMDEDHYLIVENHLVFANFNGYPSVTLPLTYVDGLPVGVNVTGKPFDEGSLFNYCLAIEKITGLKDQIAKVMD